MRKVLFLIVIQRFFAIKQRVSAIDITYIYTEKILLASAMLKHKLIANRLIDEK